MSKYEPLWEYIQKCGKPQLTMTFDEMKAQTVLFVQKKPE